MRIDGRKIAQEIRNDLKSKIQDLRSKNIVPKIAIITLGPEDSWEIYVRQKIKVARELGIKAVLLTLENAAQNKLIRTVKQIDSDSNYHGIIVQRPMPANFDRTAIINSISPEKDIDGFRPDSKFEVPVWLAVKRLLEESLSQLSVLGSQLSESGLPVVSQSVSEQKNRKQTNQILKTENRKPITDFSFVVLGKGETAGGPIARGLRKLGVEPQIIDSRTQNPDEILKKADVIISCVGKSGVLRSENLKKGVILIGVGTHGEDTGLRGDYNEQEIEQVAVAFTPTPGGVGPVNLSYLFSNLVHAAECLTKN